MMSAQALILNPLGQLKSTAWVGQFNTHGLTNDIALVFLDEFNANHRLQYFHILGKTGLSEILGHVDESCALTPRTLSLSPMSYTGEIHVFKCEDELDDAQKPRFEIPVNYFSLQQNHLELMAKILGENIYYSLHRRAISDADLRSPRSIHSYLEQIFNKEPY